MRSILYAYDIPFLIDYCEENGVTTVPSQELAWKWVRILNERVGTVDIGSVQIYGNHVVAGDNGGVLYIMDIETGDIKRTISDYEGASCGPVIADGIMYGYGGNNKWNTSSQTRYATYVWMATPYGK